MTYDFEYMLHLFACGARGMTPKPPRKAVDFERLIQLAIEQSVLPLVGAALCHAPDSGFPPEKLQSLVNSARMIAVSNFMKRRINFKLLKDFEEAGIQAVLLKGYPLADLYAEPDFRISSDTDIYVDIKDEKRAYQLLREHGCKVNPRSPLSHHAVCEHPQIGQIELHAILYGRIVEDVWFDTMDDRQYIQEDYEKYESQEGHCLTLGKTDNLIFLVLHMTKHFIAGGVSLRQMMDIALYLKAYRDQIDLQRFFCILDSLKYRDLLKTVLSMQVSYCGFSPDDFIGYTKADDSAVSALLEDLEAGGWLGMKETVERSDTWYRYSRSKYLKKKNVFFYWFYMMKRSFIRCVHALFPPRAALEARFPYAKKTMWLIPFAWTQQLFLRIMQLLHGKFHVEVAAHAAKAYEKDRFALLKLMKMI